MTKKKKRRASDIRLIAILAGVSLVLLIALVILLPRGGRDEAKTQTAAVTKAPAPTPEATAAPTEVPAPTEAPAWTEEPALTAEPEPTQMEASVPAPTQTAAALAVTMTDEQLRRAQTRPTAAGPGFLPIFDRANTEEKIVAITVDDCYQAENLQRIVDTALSVGGKLTIFPIGQNVIREKQAAILKYAWENGFELENHTWTHNGLYRCSDEELAEEIFRQQMALSAILGVEYQCHFLRPKGGDARRDQRLQTYAAQMGYYGIAHWSVSGAASNGTIAAGLKPGAIFLFHTTDADWEKLQYFIPWVASQGYRMVTLNEMFGYPANETGELLSDPAGRAAPPLEPYERVLVPYKKTSYAWGVYLLQEKLITLGYLTDEPDGVYGAGCAKAVEQFQRDHGLPATGEADVQTQEAIFAA